MKFVVHQLCSFTTHGFRVFRLYVRVWAAIFLLRPHTRFQLVDWSLFIWVTSAYLRFWMLIETNQGKFCNAYLPARLILGQGSLCPRCVCNQLHFTSYFWDSRLESSTWQSSSKWFVINMQTIISLAILADRMVPSQGVWSQSLAHWFLQIIIMIPLSK